MYCIDKQTKKSVEILVFDETILVRYYANKKYYVVSLPKSELNEFEQL